MTIEPVGTKPAKVEEEINVDLLRRVMTYIKEHPQTWRQDDWYVTFDENGWTPHLVTVEYEEQNSCGTAFCFAGHAAIMEGFPAPPKDGFWARSVDGEFHKEDAASFATKRLGLSYDVAEELFDGSNTMENLEDMVNYLIDCAENGRTPDWFEMAEIRDGSDDDDGYEEGESF